MHTFRRSKWEGWSVQHHMWGSWTSLISPSKCYKLLPHCGVCDSGMKLVTAKCLPGPNVSWPVDHSSVLLNMILCFSGLWEIECLGLYVNLVAHVKLLQTSQWLPLPSDLWVKWGDWVCHPYSIERCRDRQFLKIFFDLSFWSKYITDRCLCR